MQAVPLATSEPCKSRNLSSMEKNSVASVETLIRLERVAIAAFAHLLMITFSLTVSVTALGEPREVCELAAGNGGLAPSEVTEPPDRQLVMALTDWIARHTHYDVTLTLTRPPRIRFCKRGHPIDYEGRQVMVEPNLQAAYDLTSRTIHLVTPWNASRIEDQGILLHELIHDVQFNARAWDCLQQPEYEAYSLHAKWLKEHSLPVPFDLTQIFIWSRCNRSHH
jgi:hypothetical protein